MPKILRTIIPSSGSDWIIFLAVVATVAVGWHLFGEYAVGGLVALLFQDTTPPKNTAADAYREVAAAKREDIIAAKSEVDTIRDAQVALARAEPDTAKAITEVVKDATQDWT